MLGLPCLLCEVAGITEREAEDEGGESPGLATATGVLTCQAGTQAELLLLLGDVVSDIVRPDGLVPAVLLVYAPLKRHLCDEV